MHNWVVTKKNATKGDFILSMEVLGGGQEVGRSAFQISSGRGTVLLDYGSLVEPEPMQYPFLPTQRPDAVVLSHGHLDHCGAIPILYKKWSPSFISTDLSIELTNLLIKDSMKIADRNRNKIPFSEREHRKSLRNTEPVRYMHPTTAGDFNIELYDAGHIPGSAGVLLESGGKSIFYTGDIKVRSTHLLDGCHLPKNVNTLIIESTYSDREHPDRKKEEHGLIESVGEALGNNTIALLPTFAIGRSQELLLILKHHANQVYIDGMIKAVSEIISYYKEYTKDVSELRSILKRVNWIENSRQRAKIIKKSCIIITTAGMLGGGPVTYYIQNLYDNPNSKILFSGFLVPGTVGYRLLESGVYQNDELRRNEKNNFKVRCQMHRFDLSAHAGKSELYEIIERTKPQLVVCVHGNDCQKFAKAVEKEFRIEAKAPKNGDAIDL